MQHHNMCLEPREDVNSLGGKTFSHSCVKIQRALPVRDAIGDDIRILEKHVNG